MLFDPHIHMTSRTTDDYQAMADAGIRAIVEPAFWLGQPRTHVGSFEDYFLALLGWERFRAAQFGIRHLCTMGLNPKEANNSRVADGVMELLRLTSRKTAVVAGRGWIRRCNAGGRRLRRANQLAKEADCRSDSPPHATRRAVPSARGVGQRERLAPSSRIDHTTKRRSRRARLVAAGHSSIRTRRGRAAMVSSCQIWR